uniref:Profilin n=2 Tax=Melanaphis sacchari TaxID=742174 RepID=A0A2H8TJC5_9HEMI
MDQLEHTRKHTSHRRTQTRTCTDTLTQAHHHTTLPSPSGARLPISRFCPIFFHFSSPDCLLFRTFFASPATTPAKSRTPSVNNAQATAPDFFNMSSWQDYVDKHLLASRCVTKAAIAGHDGNVWAKSEGFDVSKEELSKIALGFENQDTLTSSGITLASVRYIYLSGTDKVIRAKQGKVGAHCVKTQQTIVVSLYEDPVQPQQAALVVEKLGDHLVAHGY